MPSKMLLIGAVLASVLSLVYSRTVEVAITAPWKEFSTGLSVQVAEYARILSSSSSTSNKPPLWAYFDNLCQHSSTIDEYLVGSNNQDLENRYKAAVEASIKPVVPEHMLSLAETMLNMGYFAASVPFFESLSQPYVNLCGNSMNLVRITYPEGLVQCDTGRSEHAGKGVTINREFDFVYPSDRDDTSST
eukprot:gene35567-43131_t